VEVLVTETQRKECVTQRKNAADQQGRKRFPSTQQRLMGRGYYALRGFCYTPSPQQNLGPRARPRAARRRAGQEVFIARASWGPVRNAQATDSYMYP
jgi:hypothetical protein